MAAHNGEIRQFAGGADRRHSDGALRGQGLDAGRRGEKAVGGGEGRDRARCLADRIGGEAFIGALQKIDKPIGGAAEFGDEFHRQTRLPAFAALRRQARENAQHGRDQIHGR